MKTRKLSTVKSKSPAATQTKAKKPVPKRKLKKMEIIDDDKSECTSELTSEPTSELTSEPTSELTKELTSEPTSELTRELTKELTSELTSANINENMNENMNDSSTVECTFRSNCVVVGIKTQPSELVPFPKYKSRMCVDIQGTPISFSANGVRGKIWKSFFKDDKKFKMYVSIQKDLHRRLYQVLSSLDSKAIKIHSPLNYHPIIQREDESEFIIRLDLGETNFERLRCMDVKHPGMDVKRPVISNEAGNKLSKNFARNFEHDINLDNFNLHYYEHPHGRRGFKAINPRLTVIDQR